MSDGEGAAIKSPASLVDEAGISFQATAGSAPRRRSRLQFDWFQKNNSCVQSHVGYVTKLSKKSRLPGN